MNVEERCGACEWCKPINSQLGECHRETPKAILVMSPNGPVNVAPCPWPMVRLTEDFCSHFEKTKKVRVFDKLPEPD